MESKVTIKVTPELYPMKCVGSTGARAGTLPSYVWGRRFSHFFCYFSDLHLRPRFLTDVSHFGSQGTSMVSKNFKMGTLKSTKMRPECFAGSPWETLGPPLEAEVARYSQDLKNRCPRLENGFEINTK